MEHTKNFTKYFWIERPDEDLSYAVLLEDPIRGECIAAFLDAEDAKCFCIDKKLDEIHDSILTTKDKLGYALGVLERSLSFNTMISIKDFVSVISKQNDALLDACKAFISALNNTNPDAGEEMGAAETKAKQAIAGAEVK